MAADAFVCVPATAADPPTSGESLTGETVAHSGDPGELVNAVAGPRQTRRLFVWLLKGWFCREGVFPLQLSILFRVPTHLPLFPFMQRSGVLSLSDADALTLPLLYVRWGACLVSCNLCWTKVWPSPQLRSMR